MYSALHAHTLLLDLEQLGVMANLSKKNLISSSSTSTYIQEKDDDTTGGCKGSSPGPVYVFEYQFILCRKLD